MTFSYNIQLVYNCVENNSTDCIFSINVNRFISLLILLLVWCLDYSSVSIANLPIFKCSFFLLCFIESFTLAKVSITLPRLYVFMNWIAASIFINRIFRFSRVRVTIQVSCPCFFLVYLNILRHWYSLIMNTITKSLNTAAGWNKYYFDLIGRLAYSTSHFKSPLFKSTRKIFKSRHQFIYMLLWELLEKKWKW